MSIIGWIVLGLIAGFIASKIVDKRGGGIVLDIFLGIISAPFRLPHTAQIATLNLGTGVHLRNPG